LGKKVEEINQQWSITHESLNSTRLKFILENPKSYVTPDYLHLLEANEVISLDSLKLIFNGLDNSIQKSRIGKIISDDVRRKENIRIGAQAPEFKAIDLNGQVITLSKFKGKSVVLDFWASWCIPCRAGFPHLKNLYKQYHHQGFDVIAVSTDWKRDAWIKAVKQDSIEMWYNVAVAEKYASGPSYITKDDIYKNYFVQAIPVQLLIDKEGKIVGRWLGKSQENEDALDKELKEIFNK
jgi:peroxiredoxin